MKYRLFLAIDLSDTIRDLLDSYRSVRIIDHPRWVPKENYHITVNFYGNVEEDKANELSDVLGDITRTVKPFTLTVERVEFAPPKRPRMLWGKFRENEGYYTFVKQTEKIIPEKTGIQFGRNKMTPHITLARFSEPEAVKTATIPHITIPPVEVRECHLYSSVLNPSLPPVYTKLRSYSLGR